MYHYTAYGLNITSELEFPQLIKSHTGDDVNIRLEKLDTSSEVEIRSGETYKITSTGIYLNWPDTVTLKIKDGKQILVDPHSQEWEEIRFLILGPAFAVLLYQRGLTVLHGSAVNIHGQGVAFLGEVGTGKSTLARALKSKGHQIVSDDILPIIFDGEDTLLLPGYPQLRLHPDVIKHFQDEKKSQPISSDQYKFSRSLEEFSQDSLPLKHIYLLERDGEVNQYSMTSIRTQEALMELVKNSFCLVLFQKDEMSSNLENCARLVRQVPISRLRVKNSLEELTQLTKILEDNLEA